MFIMVILGRDEVEHTSRTFRFNTERDKEKSILSIHRT